MALCDGIANGEAVELEVEARGLPRGWAVRGGVLPAAPMARFGTGWCRAIRCGAGGGIPRLAVRAEAYRAWRAGLTKAGAPAIPCSCSVPPQGLVNGCLAG